MVTIQSYLGLFVARLQCLSKQAHIETCFKKLSAKLIDREKGSETNVVINTANKPPIALMSLIGVKYLIGTGSYSQEIINLAYFLMVVMFF